MRRLAAVLAVCLLGFVALSGVPASAAAPGASVSWPTVKPGIGDVATVEVTGTGLSGATKVFLFKKANYPDGAFERFEFISPEEPSVSMRLKTNEPGTTDYIVTVGNVEGRPDFITRSDYTLTVNGKESTLDVSFPAGPLKANEKALITGTVSGTPGRQVLIQHQAENNSWVTLTETTSQADRSFSVLAPTWWVNSLTLRAVAPATASDGSVTSDGTSTLVVKRTYTPRAGSNYSLVYPASNARWNPCETISFQVNTKMAPKGAVRQVKKSFAVISQATGLRFSYVGKTKFVPLAKRNPSGVISQGADITVAWTNPKTVPALRKAKSLGGASQVILAGEYGQLRQGYAVFKSGVKYAKSKTKNKAAAANDLLTRLGNTVGVGGSTDKQQVMHKSYNVSAQFAEGDLLGLAVVGADQGCFGMSQ